MVKEGDIISAFSIPTNNGDFELKTINKNKSVIFFDRFYWDERYNTILFSFVINCGELFLFISFSRRFRDSGPRN